MLRSSGTTGFVLVFALALCANPLLAQGQSALQPAVELTTNGGAFDFDGVGPGLDLGTSSAVDLSGGDFTVHAWVRFASLCPNIDWCDEPIVTNMATPNPSPNAHGWHLMKQNDQRFWFCLGGGDGINGCDVGVNTTVMSSTVPAIGAWYDVVGVKASNKIMIYINGVLEGSSTLGSFSDASAEPLLIGASHEGFHLDGQVAEVKLYRSALSASDIRALYNASKKTYEGQQSLYSFISIDPPGSVESHANGINAQGDIVGRFIDQKGQSHAFLFSNGNYRIIDIDGFAFVGANDINARGDIFAWDTNGGNYLVRGGEVISFNFPGALWTSAARISDPGDIVGTYGEVPYTECGPYYGFLLSKGEYTQIELPVANVSGIAVHGINDAGELVGVYTIGGCDESNPAYHGFLLGNGTFTKIDAPNAFATVAYGINERGAIVGTYNRAGERNHGFLLSKGVLTDIDFPGSQHTRAKDINDRGWIVGDYRVPGATHGFLAIRK